MHVVLPAHRPRVAESLRHLIDRADDIRVSLFLGGESADLAQRVRRQHGASEGPKVLGRHLPPRDLAEILIDVAGVDALATSIIVEVLEQLLSGQLLTVLNDPSDATVGDRNRVRHAALAAELEAKLGARHRDVSSAKRREPEGAVVARVLVAADADERLLQQPHDRGEHFFTRKRRLRDVLLDASPDARQHFAELDHSAELRVVANLAIPRVIAVLLATPCVPGGDLQVSAGRRTDPHVRPSRRDHELPNALEIGGIAERGAVRSRVRKAAPAPPASNAGGRVGDVPKTGGLRRLDVFIREAHPAFGTSPLPTSETARGT